jgi:hypothetical protein
MQKYRVKKFRFFVALCFLVVGILLFNYNGRVVNEIKMWFDRNADETTQTLSRNAGQPEGTQTLPQRATSPGAEGVHEPWLAVQTQTANIIHHEGEEITDDEAFLYGLIYLHYQDLGYDLSLATVTQTNGQIVDGLAYSDGSVFEKDDAVYLGAGFVPLTLTETNIAVGAIATPLDEDADIQFIVAFDLAIEPTQYVYNGKHIKYEVKNRMLVASIQPNTWNFTAEYGAVFDHDLGYTIYDPELGSAFDDRNAYSLNAPVDYDEMVEQITMFTQNQSELGAQSKEDRVTVFTQQAINDIYAYLQGETFLGEIAEQIEYIEAHIDNSYYCFIDADGNAVVREMPPRESNQLVGWGYIVCGAILEALAVGFMAIAVITTPTIIGPIIAGIVALTLAYLGSELMQNGIVELTDTKAADRIMHGVGGGMLIIDAVFLTVIGIALCATGVGAWVGVPLLLVAIGEVLFGVNDLTYAFTGHDLICEKWGLDQALYGWIEFGFGIASIALTIGGITLLTKLKATAATSIAEDITKATKHTEELTGGGVKVVDEAVTRNYEFPDNYKSSTWRKKAVDDFWANETEILNQYGYDAPSKWSRPWSSDEFNIIKNGGIPNGYNGHHGYSVKYCEAMYNKTGNIDWLNKIKDYKNIYPLKSGVGQTEHWFMHNGGHYRIQTNDEIADIIKKLMAGGTYKHE